MRRSSKIFSGVLAAGLVCLPAALWIAPESLPAQAPSFRSVTGTVTDKSGAKVKGAIVHLKDTRSLAQRTFITADDGSFRFAQLSTTTDYDVWADLNGKKTSIKSISSFDTKKTVELGLKMPS